MANPCNIPGCDRARWAHSDPDGNMVFEPYCKPHAQDPQSHLRDVERECRPDDKQIGGFGFCNLEPIPYDPDREPDETKYDGPPPRQPWQVWRSMSLAERKLFAPLLEADSIVALDHALDHAFEAEK